MSRTNRGVALAVANWPTGQLLCCAVLFLRALSMVAGRDTLRQRVASLGVPCAMHKSRCISPAGATAARVMQLPCVCMHAIGLCGIGLATRASEPLGMAPQLQAGFWLCVSWLWWWVAILFLQLNLVLNTTYLHFWCLDSVCVDYDLWRCCACHHPPWCPLAHVT